MTFDDMNTLELTYELAGGDLASLDSCCLSRNEEQADTIRGALHSLKVIAEYDPDWGFLRLVSVNGIPLEK